MKRSELESFLQRTRSAGALDSEGHFTLNVAQAMEKLGKFQLPAPEFFVLKAIQAGVSAGAPCIKVTTARWRTRVEFEAKLEPLTSLLGWLTGSSEKLTRPQRHLLVGLMAAPAPWSLQVGTALLVGDMSSLSISETEESSTVVWEVKSSKKVADVVARRARFSATPVLLNGKPCLAHWDTWGPNRKVLGDSADRLQVLYPGSGLRLPALPQAELEPQGSLWLWRGPGRWRGTGFAGRRPCWITKSMGQMPASGTFMELSRLLRWPLQSAANMLATFVIDGVALPRFSVPNSTMDGYEVLQHAPWAKTDISGFRVNQDDERFAQFMSEIVPGKPGLDALFLHNLGRLRPVVRGRIRPLTPRFENLLLMDAQEAMRAEGDLGLADNGRYRVMGSFKQGVRLGWDRVTRELVQLRVVAGEKWTFVHRDVCYRVEPL